MPARSEWKGCLQVNQLQIPVKAYSAVSSQLPITLNQLHGNCGQRIQRKTVCPVHGELQTDEVVSGYHVADELYLPIAPEVLKQLSPARNKSLRVEHFIGCDQIDPVFHTGRTLYLVPDSPPAQRPFAVLREGMKLSRRFAFSRFVLSQRERLVLLRPLGKLIAVSVIHFPQQVRCAPDYEGEVTTLAPGKRELELMQQLIEALTDDDFDLTRYRDPYTDGLSSLIERLVAEADLVSAPRDAAATTDSNSDMADADAAMLAMLKASLDEAGIPDAPDRSETHPYTSHVAESTSAQKLA